MKNPEQRIADLKAIAKRYGYRDVSSGHLKDALKIINKQDKKIKKLQKGRKTALFALQEVWWNLDTNTEESKTKAIASLFDVIKVLLEE
jgi:hypothetical protein